MPFIPEWIGYEGELLAARASDDRLGILQHSGESREYVLHCGRIEGATHSVAAGMQPAAIQWGGRWRSRTLM